MDEIPIDPSLLDEEGDLADAEGELDETEWPPQQAQLQPEANYNDPLHSWSPVNEIHYDQYDTSAPPVYPPPHEHLSIRSSRRRQSANQPEFDTLSSISGSTPAPIAKKRGRPPKNSTPNGHAPVSHSVPGPSKPSLHLAKGHPHAPSTKPKTKANGLINVRPPRDLLCSFCRGTDTRNKEGVEEKMTSCARCGRSGHPSCLNMLDGRLKRKVFTYDWCCIECKTCEICEVKGDDSRLMFCDGCDRGWHSYCLNPPLANPPKGKWLCPTCRAERAEKHAYKMQTAVAPTPEPTRNSGKGKGRASLAELVTPSTSAPITRRGRPPGSKDLKPRVRGRPSNASRLSQAHLLLDDEDDEDEDDDEFFGDHSRSRPRIKRKDKGKGRAVSSDHEEMIPNIKIRLRVSSGAKAIEVEEEEEKVPYGGVITGEDADTSKTSILDSDKLAFERSRKAAEARLGGPPPEAVWDPQKSGQESPAPSMVNGHASTPGPSFSKSHSTPALSRGLRDRVLQQTISHAPSTPSHGSVAPASTSEKIKTIRFGVYDIDTWYSAPYPEEYQYVPDGRLWLCEFCLKYMKSGFVAGRHRIKCKARHPPGDEIYRDGNISVFEVDGRKNKIYCQNLCLLAKMFLEAKTLYYDVEPFLFYVMTEVDDLGARLVGYFSKEKRSPDNNVSCIMTLPVRQRKGWGQLLIDFSYALTKKEGRVGSPEKPLSGLGEVTYKRYWMITVFNYLRQSSGTVTMEDISAATAMTIVDIYSVLVSEDMITSLDVATNHSPLKRTWTPRGRGRGRARGRGGHSVRRIAHSPSDDTGSLGSGRNSSGNGHQTGYGQIQKVQIPNSYVIDFDRAYVEAVLSKYESKGYLKLRPERLKYHPFLVTREIKPAGQVAQAMLANTTAVVSNSGNLTANGQGTGKGVRMQGEEDTLSSIDGEGPTSHKVTDEIVAGEDEATLELVAALSSDSPTRNLRKRPRTSDADGNGSVTNSPARKRLRSTTSRTTLSPETLSSRPTRSNRTRSTLVNGHHEETEIGKVYLETITKRSSVKTTWRGRGPNAIDDTEEEEEELEEPFEVADDGERKGDEVDAAGEDVDVDNDVDAEGEDVDDDIDAEGEEDVDAEGEDEYVE